MMDESIAKLNIEHYKKLLTFEIDAAKRKSVTRLLAAEEATLAKIVKERKRLIYRFSTHSRQWVGLTSIRLFDPAFIQPPEIRRQGKTSA